MNEMYLRKLSLLNFKNHSERNADFSDRINAIVGDNGSGKTNLLDAIYYLSFGKSFLNPFDSQNTTHGSEYFMIQGYYFRKGKDEKLHVGFSNQGKKLCKKNDKAYSRLADHIGHLPLVIIAPYDTELILGGSDLRRKFMDGIIAQYDKTYLEHLLHYKKALKQRNNLLKAFREHGRFDELTLSIWNEHLIANGAPIFEKRKQLMDEISEIFVSTYQELSGGKERPSILYSSELHDNDFEKLLSEALQRDRTAMNTSVGIHRDDLIFDLEGYPIKKTGSQGQQKTFLLSLKLSQFDLIHKKHGIKPILLLDDIFDKLDENRIKALLRMVSADHFGQIFISDTNQQRVERWFSEIEIEPRILKIESDVH
jgi:DNA replication and repair protein RecF